MASAKKSAQVLTREVGAKLRERFKEVSLTVVESVDGSGNPTLLVSDGTAAAGEQVVFIRFLEYPQIGTNSIGLAQDSFGPHIAQVAMETSSVANCSLVTEANKARLYMELLKLGCRVEVYLENNLTVPSVTSIDAAKLKITLDSLYWPLAATT